MTTMLYLEICDKESEEAINEKLDSFLINEEKVDELEKYLINLWNDNLTKENIYLRVELQNYENGTGLQVPLDKSIKDEIVQKIKNEFEYRG